MNREAWLMEVAGKVVPRIQEVTQKEMPDYRISVGWPSRGGLSVKKRVIGQCWDGMVSSTGHSELFISPILTDRIEIAATVAHELIHANVGTKEKHGKVFSRTARAIGLRGKPTATVAGSEFKEFVEGFIGQIPSYPHGGMTPNAQFKVAKTYLIKLECRTCGYPARVTRKWIKEVGTLNCPLHGPMAEG